MSNWRRIWLVTGINFLGLLLLAGMNHALSGWNLFLTLHALFIMFAGLRMTLSSGLIVTALVASMSSAFMYQVDLLPWYLLSYALVFVFFFRMRLKVRRNNFYSLASIAAVGAFSLFFLLTAVNQIYYGNEFGWKSLFYDFIISVGATALLAKWFIELHFSIFLLLGTNLNKEVITS